MSQPAPILSIEKHFRYGMNAKETLFNEYFKVWQTREPQWKNRLGDGWKISKTLGAGAGGGASLWEWRGDPRAKNAPKLKQVVVKLVYDGYEKYPDSYTGLRGEAAFLDLLRKIPTKHIVHMYGPPKMDDRGHVMYFLEMCPGGALSSLLDKHIDQGLKFPVSETDMWSVFFCLAQAVTVLDRGTEDLSKKMWDKDEIGHYDMITSNVLIGYCDKIHRRCPAIKIGDFGDAMEVRRLELQTDDTAKIDRQERGAIACRPPEQRDVDVDHPRHGTCSNVYMVGLIMLGLLDSQVSVFMPSQGYTVNYNERLRKGLNMAYYLDDEKDIKNAYSQMLRALIMECCMKEPLLRPRAVELQERTGMMFQLVQNELIADTLGNHACPGLGTENVLLEDLEPPKEWLI
ncbi:hypothetical protein BHYA_0120g00310 [Botrytis hyacinthi]|uniref:Protein kinase domain-containing protein n=1 Tax=Botrytis hyacinthi TaxID=278943 RepID=A0A4Z1GIB0_9HELO|nr:hypothetical protein BHYA_0120g00310 [Botrytis hyacinthi]